jgi:hypothetical protein
MAASKGFLVERRGGNGLDVEGGCIAKCEEPYWKLWPRLASACRLKASNSGLASKGINIVIAATIDLTEDVGGL